MVYYIGATVLSVVISFIINKFWGFEKNKTLKMFISILPLTLISAFRYDVGWDYIKGYVNGFYMVGKYKVDYFSEPGFLLLIKIIYKTTHNYVVLFACMSILTSFFFSKCYKEYGDKKYYYFYIILFVLTRFYFCSLNIIRQALAMMIILYSLSFYEKKNYSKFFLLILLASQFHFLSLIYLPLCFLLNCNFKLKKDFMKLFICLPILGIMIFVFVVNSKYMNYFITMFGNNGTLAYSELILAFVLLLFCIPVQKKLKKFRMYRVFFNMECIILILGLLSFKLPTIDRIIWYFSMQNIFLIPMIIDSWEIPKNKLLITTIILLSLTIVFLNQTLKVDSYSILPYQSVFSN